MRHGKLLAQRELRSLAQAYLEPMDSLAQHPSDPVGIHAHIDDLGRVWFSAFKIVGGPTRDQVRNVTGFLIECCGLISGIEDLIAEALGGEAA